VPLGGGALQKDKGLTRGEVYWCRGTYKKGEENRRKKELGGVKRGVVELFFYYYSRDHPYPGERIGPGEGEQDRGQGIKAITEG